MVEVKVLGKIIGNADSFEDGVYQYFQPQDGFKIFLAYGDFFRVNYEEDRFEYCRKDRHVYHINGILDTLNKYYKYQWDMDD